MWRRDVDVVRPAHQAVADIDDKGAWHGRRLDPLAGAGPRFEAADIVGREQGQVAIVGVDAGADLLNGLIRSRRIMQEAQRRHRTHELVVEKVGPEAEVVGEGAMQTLTESSAGVVIGEQRRPESRQPRPGVEGTERPAGQKLGIVGREVETDVEGLFSIGAARRVERLAHQAEIAAVAADPVAGDRLLILERKGEEAARLRRRPAAIRALSTP